MPTPGKVLRLATACNLCRSHKIKCDTEQPSCSNCRRRGVECVTTDLRKGGGIGKRVEPVGREGRSYGKKRPLPPSETQPESASIPSTPMQDAGLDFWDSNGGLSVRRSEPNQSTLGSTIQQSGVNSESTSEKAIFSLPFSLHDPDRRGNGSVTRDISNNNPPPSHGMHMSGGMDLTMLTDDTSGRLQMMGISSSLYILIQWLDLFFTQRSGMKTIFPHFRQGMAYTVCLSIRT